MGPAPPQVLLEEQHGDRTICAHKSPPACFFISFNMNLPACPVPVTYEASRTTVVPRLIASRDSARQRDQFEKSSPPWTPPVRSILRSICVTRNPDAFHTSRYFERLTSGISKTSIRLFFFFFFSFCAPCIFFEAAQRVRTICREDKFSRRFYPDCRRKYVCWKTSDFIARDFSMQIMYKRIFRIIILFVA